MWRNTFFYLFYYFHQCPSSSIAGFGVQQFHMQLIHHLCDYVNLTCILPQPPDFSQFLYGSCDHFSYPLCTLFTSTASFSSCVGQNCTWYSRCGNTKVLCSSRIVPSVFSVTFLMLPNILLAFLSAAAPWANDSESCQQKHQGVSPKF